MLLSPDSAYAVARSSKLLEVLRFLRSIANEGGLDVAPEAQPTPQLTGDPKLLRLVSPQTGKAMAVGLVGASVGVIEILDMLSDLFA